MRTHRPALPLALMAGVLLVSLEPLAGQERSFPPVAPTDPLPPDREQAALHVPSGFRITLFAAEPLIGKPMNLAFDARGRVWVTQSFEYPFPAADPASARDRITVLEDTDGDGRADRARVFADRLNIPIGLLPVPGGAIAYSIPHVWHFLDDDGDGTAETRQPILGPFGYADTHGMVNSFTWGFDGWVYACHGFANHSRPRARGGTELSLHSGNTIRFPYDARTVEQFSWGQVNPFGLAFDEYGDLFSADCHSRPISLLLRFGYYPSFGKPHDGLGFVPPICSHDHGSTAIAGICFLLDDRWPEAWRGAVLTGNVVTNRVQSDRLRWQGATPTAEHGPDFVRSDDLWFRPVDVKLGPDGAVYIADFYNRIIGHYEVPLTHPGRDRTRGRIWRIEYVAAGRQARPPRLDQADAAALVAYLGHPNFTVRMLAANELVFRIGRPAARRLTAVVRSSDRSNPRQRVHSLWVLYRLGRLSHEVLWTAARDPDPRVRAHAARVCGRMGAEDPRRREVLAMLAQDRSARVRFAAVQAMAEAPHEDYVDAVLAVLRQAANDPLLRHAARIALRNHLQLRQVQERWRRALTAPSAHAFADVAQGIQHPSVARLYLRWIIETGAPLDSQAAAYLAATLPVSDLETLAERAVVGRTSSADTLQLLAAILRRLRGAARQVPNPLRRLAEREVARALKCRDQQALLAAIELVEALDDDHHLAAIAALACNERVPVPVRVRALRMFAARSDPRLGALLDQLFARPLQQPQLTLAAVDYAVAVDGPEMAERLRVLLATLPSTAATAVAVRLAGSRDGLALLVGEVEQGRVPVDVLLHPAVRAAAEAYPDLARRLSELTQDVPRRDQRVTELIRRIGENADKVLRADTKLGQELFQKHCAPCHKLRGVGGDIGPTLDGIGARGLQRLAEDVLDPNRNVDRTFWRTLVVLRDGRVLSGLVRATAESPRTIVLVDENAEPHRIARSEIERMRRVRMSPMPDNFAEVLSEAELHALLAYLLGQSGTTRVQTSD